LGKVTKSISFSAKSIIGFSAKSIIGFSATCLPTHQKTFKGWWVGGVKFPGYSAKSISLLAFQPSLLASQIEAIGFSATCLLAFQQLKLATGLTTHHETFKGG
jgi:hypothetical protein